MRIGITPNARHARLFGCSMLIAGLLLPAAAAEQTVDYERQIKPLLREKCFACHGALKQESGLRLDTVQAMRSGGDGGAALVPGDAVASPLLDRVRGIGGDLMPLEGVPLSPEQIALLESWIQEGARAPDKEQPEPDPREHWSFRPPQRPPLPASRSGRAIHPIDAFLLAEIERQGLAVVPPASKEVLLRRVYLDLTGLPPTPEDLHAFLDDHAAGAYERVVDRLLNSPQYGERWARHWMDVWRYSDWFGRRMVPDVWNSAPQIWRWRDWIIRSLNNDHGYDRMMREMIAADEIAPGDPDAAVATGYLIRNWYALNPNDWMRQNVEHTAKAFLGLTFNCAHCHDHKYDPITHEDYFQFRAFFEPIGIRQDRVAGEADPGPFQEYEYLVLRKIVRLGSVQIFDKRLDAPTWFYTGGDERQRVAEKGSIPPGLPDVLSPADFAITPVELPLEAWYPGARADIQETIRAEHQAALDKAAAALEEARSTIEQARPQLEAELAQTEAQWNAAVETAHAAGDSIALAGRQSLLLDATTGRRALSNNVTALQAFGEGTTLRFEIMILADAHVNFQLARDTAQGLTAGLVAFDQGKIISYQPGTTTEFPVGTYDFAAGQKRFAVELEFHPGDDRALLTITARPAETVLAKQVPIALNSWNPVGNPLQAISFDARPGSRAVVDSFAIRSPQVATADSTSIPLIAFDFEAPLYPEGSDVVGREGWVASQFSVAPATSIVASTIGTPELQELRQTLTARRQALAANQQKLPAAEAVYAARQADMDSFQARLAADNAQYRGSDPAVAEVAAEAAAVAEKKARALSLAAAVQEKQQLLAEAEAKLPSDPMRAAAIDMATKQLTEAEAARAKAASAPVVAEGPSAYTPLTPQYPRQSSGRRRALAEWLGSRNNPLSARVAINHIWMRHFHEPLVPTVFDFGRNGKAPTHPELLDWLAVEFMESGWSMKHIHRLIVTSDAYRRSSSSVAAPASLAADPENKYLWRMNAGRMEAEAVRDSLLSVARRLDGTMGGQELETAQAMTTRRRSLYYACHPEGDGKSPLGALFDAANATECYRRTRSIIPQQALALTNSDLVHELSIEIAADLARPVNNDPAENAAVLFIDRAFERLLSRSPSEAERQYCHAFLERQATLLNSTEPAEAPRRAQESLVRALLNHNDFITIR